MKRTFSTLLLFCLAISGFAKVDLPEILGDNMMLQQQTEVNLWGNAAAQKPIIVKTSWTKEVFKTQTNDNGEWFIKIKTPKASFTPQQITISDGEPLTIQNILIGEVWFASGQSNMEMPLNGFWGAPIAGANEAIAHAGDFQKSIRFVTIPKTDATTPQSRVKGKWVLCSPQTAPMFSATAYFFATQMTQILQVPVGIIHCSWGGTRVESWSNRALCESYGEDLSEANLKSIAAENWKRPLVMYNGMLHPLVNYTIKGFIFYQGCSNVGQDKEYAQRLSNMVHLWRSLWKQGDIPFYFTEIASYTYGGEDSAPLLREAQYKAQSLIPNSAMISTVDLVEPFQFTNIHPRNKQDVGKRLAYMALHRTYGFSSIACNGPEYDTMDIKESNIFLRFKYAQDAFNRDFGFEGFEVAGNDRVFYPATARVIYNDSDISMEIHSSHVEAPVAVRYCFHNTNVATVFNTRGLPLVPFRSDSW